MTTLADWKRTEGYPACEPTPPAGPMPRMLARASSAVRRRMRRRRSRVIGERPRVAGGIGRPYARLVTERIPRDVQRFASERHDVAGVIQRIGLDTWDLLLIDADGNWTRLVTASKEAAEAAGRELRVELHDGWDADDFAKRMNRRDHWNAPGGQRRAV